jgi:DNA topoisomerase-1
MYEHVESEKAKKKAMSSAEKKELKKAKDAFELPYITCLLDGRKEKIGNFRVEPPGLFRGRGEHPKKGALKVWACLNYVSWYHSSCSLVSAPRTA